MMGSPIPIRRKRRGKVLDVVSTAIPGGAAARNDQAHRRRDFRHKTSKKPITYAHHHTKKIAPTPPSVAAPCCVPGTAHVLKSESKLPRSDDFGKS